MINKKMLPWMEKALQGTVVALALSTAFITTSGITRLLVAAVIGLVLFNVATSKRGRQWDEREVYLNYVASYLAYLTTFSAIFIVMLTQYLQTGTVSKGMGILMGIGGLSHWAFLTYLQRQSVE